VSRSLQVFEALNEAFLIGALMRGLRVQRGLFLLAERTR
jgi:hypothetical protein